MERMKWTIQDDGGQGLVEVMLAVAVVLTVVYSLLNLGALGLRNARLSSDRAEATRLMQEGLEILRAARDADGGWPRTLSYPTGTALCFDTGTLDVRSDCYEVNGEFKTTLLLDGVFERTFAVETVSRESDVSCPGGCSACGKVINSGGYNDNCSRKITMQVAWPGVAEACNSHPILGVSGQKYCSSTTTVLTNWQ